MNEKLVVVLLLITIVLSIILSSKSGQFFNFEVFWDKDDVEAINWVCQNPGRYKITHTENSYRYLSKEPTYNKLKEILCPKEKLFFHPVQKSCKKPIYQKGYIQICS